MVMRTRKLSNPHYKGAKCLEPLVAPPLLAVARKRESRIKRKI